MDRRTLKILRAALFLNVLALAADALAAETPITQTIVIDNFSFKPNSISVPVGTHIVFENHDDLPHSVVIPDLHQKSALMDTDGHYEALLDRPGQFKFFCGIHPMMTGEITVTQ